MDTMYRRRCPGGGRRMAGKKRTSPLPGRERRRLLQLAGSIALFLLVYFGRGILPGQTVMWRAILGTDTDFRGVAEMFGEVLSGERGALEALAVFFSAGEDAPVEGGEEVFAAPDLPKLPDYVQRAYAPGIGEAPMPEQRSIPDAVPSEEVVVTAVAQSVDAQGTTLPERVSLQYYALGLAETVTPVMGTVTSPFGFRDHPVSGEYTFHTAVDIGVDTGTEVLAFGDGTVRYIGENDVFGLYLKIDHDNGVSTFYAHCDALLVGKGERVVCGQVVAKSGETGNATGPHLHFSIEKDGIRLDPAYYLDLG